MAISGITTTDNNGVRRITDTQNITGTGTIDGETIVLDDGDARLKASSNGSVVVTNSQIKLDSDVTGSNDGNAVINYGGRATTTTTMKFVDSTILASPFTGRKNIMVTWLERVSVIESGNTNNLFCYTSKDSHVEDVLFRGIRVWEVYRSPAVAFNIKVSDVGFGYLNWEAGRLDFFGFATQNISSGHIWHGTGNSGRNYSYHWNPDTSVDFEKLYLTHANNRVYIGYTATWEFIDVSNNSKISDVYVSYSDDRSGSKTLLGEYVTNSNGRLKGTWDSQFNTTGSDIERPTLFTWDKQIIHVDTGSAGAYTYPVAVITGEQGDRQKNYDIDEVTAYVEIRSYAHILVTGYTPSDTFTPTTEIGSINADKSVARYSKFFLIPDVGVTVTKSTALGYTKIDTLEKLYDRCKAEWRDNSNHPIPQKDGVKIDFGSTSLVIDGSSGTAYSYSSPTITIKSDGSIIKTNKFETILTTGTITINNNATVNGINFEGTIHLNQATNLSNINIVGNLYINTGSDSELDFSNVSVSGNIYNNDTSHTLTINLKQGSTATAGDAGSGNGETNVLKPVPIKVTVKDITSGDLLQNARVLLRADVGGDLAENTVIVNELTDNHGEVNKTFNYTSDQPIKGKVRKATP